MVGRIADFFRDENGASAVEYGLVLAFAGLVVAGALWGFESQIEEFFTGFVTDSLPASENEITGGTD